MLDEYDVLVMNRWMNPSAVRLPDVEIARASSSVYQAQLSFVLDKVV